MTLPHKVKYTDKVVGGDAKYFRIRINPKYKDDAGLMAHEYEHIVQWYKSVAVLSALVVLISIFSLPYAIALSPIVFFGHNILYRSKFYRKYCETRAIREQLKHYSPSMLDWGAERLSKDYNLDISKEQALKELVG